MKNKIVYTDEEMQFGEKIEDFLPSPQDLVLKRSLTRITLELSKESVDFFKAEAKKYNGSYQAMIRHLIDKYVENYQNK
jgi:predicted DNA binding CopG/RHH family protein